MYGRQELSPVAVIAQPTLERLRRADSRMAAIGALASGSGHCGTACVYRRHGHVRLITRRQQLQILSSQPRSTSFAIPHPSGGRSTSWQIALKCAEIKTIEL